MSHHQTHTSPLAIERMADGRCPECGGQVVEHSGWGAPRGCSLTDNGAAARLHQFQHDQTTTPKETA